MSDQSNRIICPHCQANNFPSSATCWQCGRPIFAEGQQPEGPAPSTPPSPEQMPPPASGGGMPPPYPPTRRSDTQILITLGYVFAGLSLIPICCAWPLGITAIILGIVALTKGDSRGTWVIVAGVSALIISFVVGQVIGIYILKHMPEIYKGRGGAWPPMPTPR